MKSVRKPKAPATAAAPIVEVQTTKPVTGKTTFSFRLPTPMWATWIFRTEFILNKALTYWITSTAMVPPNKVKETLLIMASVDLATWTLARSLGVKKEDIEN
jgi:uncharacterized membrane protein YbaN (DUF454 family)